MMKFGQVEEVGSADANGAGRTLIAAARPLKREEAKPGEARYQEDMVGFLLKGVGKDGSGEIAAFHA